MQSNSGRHPTPLFWYLGLHGNVILNCINTPKASTRYGEYSNDVSWSLMKNHSFLNPPFYFHSNCGKVFPTDCDFFWLISFDQMCMWQETLLQNFVKLKVNLTFFAPWLPWQRPPFWIYSTPQQLPHTTVDIPTKFHEVWWKESNIILNPPFFVSMATAKFVQPIPICLAYLVPLAVDVVPIRLHQFLFGE